MSNPTPDESSPVWRWLEQRRGTAVAFLGRGAGATAGDAIHWLSPAPEAVSWLRQVHSDSVLRARPGLTGDGDALVSTDLSLGLAVATADCVPVLLSGGGSIAAAHAGWRGLEAKVIGATLSALDSATQIEAWIGPAIGPCCYEIGEDVATRLRTVAPPETLAIGSSGRTHADLPGIARHQLGEAGISRIRSIDLCTRCEVPLLESFRRDGAEAGRNWAVIWKTGPPPAR